MIVRELIKELEKLDQEMAVIVPTDINDYRFYTVEGIHLFDLENPDNEVEKIACLSRYPSWPRVKKVRGENITDYWEFEQ